MSKEKNYTIEEIHKKMAVDCFNKTWEYIEKDDRTPLDDEMMICSAHASRYHWGQIGEEINFQRGEWQISRVYSILKRAEPAQFHAKLCLELTEKNDFKGFDLAFANECMARASAAAGNKEDFEKYYELAKEAGGKIEGKEDQDYFFSDLNGGEWFEMR